MKLTKTALKRKCDLLFSKIIRKRGFCEWCHSHDRTLQTAHVYSRSNMRLRYNSQNVLCLCASCHFKAHREPLMFGEFFLSNFPERANYLAKEKDKYLKFTIKDYQDLYKNLKEKL